jgi:hypothetical protein
MAIEAITRYEASCDICRRSLDDAESGDRADFPDPESAAEYAERHGWIVWPDGLICPRQNESHAQMLARRAGRQRATTSQTGV